MEPEELRARTKAFAVQVIRFVKTTIPSDAISTEIARQLVEGSATTQWERRWEWEDQLVARQVFPRLVTYLFQFGQ